MVEYQTLARRAVARQLEKEMMSEELRLLYVAMTRAQEKLIMTVALSDGPKALERLAGETGAPVSPVALERQQSVGQWVLLHALTRPEGEPLRELAGRACPIAQNLGPAWDIRWVSGESLEEEPEDRGRFGDAPAQDGEALEDLTAALTWTYPHQGAVDCPSKLTATQLKGRALDQEAAQEAASPVVPEEPAPIRRPDFVARERGLTPTQRGSAIHLAMQYLPVHRRAHSPRHPAGAGAPGEGGLPHSPAGGGGGPQAPGGLLRLGAGTAGAGVPPGGAGI